MNDEVLKPKVGYGCPEIAVIRDPMDSRIRVAADYHVVMTSLIEMSNIIPSVKPNNMLMKIRNTANQAGEQHDN